MAKIRIYELAKELTEANISDSKNLNSEIIGVLAKKGIEVKSASSGIEAEDAEYIRNYFKGNKPAEKKPANAEVQNAAPAVKNETPAAKTAAKNDTAKPAVKNDSARPASDAKRPSPANGDGKRPDSRPGQRPQGDRPAVVKQHPIDGRLIDKNGKETPYWVAKDGRLVGMDGKALPLKMNADKQIVRLDGSPLKRRPNPADSRKDTEKKNESVQSENNIDKIEEKRENSTVSAVNESKENGAPEVETKPAQEEKSDLGPQPKIVGNIFDSMTMAKNKEAAQKERRAQNQGQQRFDRNDRSNRPDRNDRGERNFGDRRPQNSDRNNQRHDRPDGNRPERSDRPFGERNFTDRQDRPYNRDGQSRPFDRNNNGDRKPFDRNNNGGFNKGRAPMGGGAPFADKDKDDDNSRRQFASKKPSRPSADGQLKSELSTQIGKNDRAGKLKNKGKDKKDKRDYDEENLLAAKKKDPNRKGAFQKPVKVVEPVEEDEIKTISIPEMITIKELADKMKQNAGAIIKKLFLQGKMINQNSEITFEEAEEIALEYEIICEKEKKVNIIEELLKETEEDPDTLVKRPPVVCVMGHVDHGKTSLLDAIRETNVTAREAGGITQHIGAYMVEINGQKITFLDTPGHEAFTSMRMRGAKSTDIAILVVAADDGVMPQTIEAINHAKAANVTIIVAINKIDKPGANIERVKQELTEYGLIAEDWGGDTVFVPVSAKTREGIENLLEMVLLTSDVLELKSNPNRKARGIVIEAERDRGKGCIATVLVQKGTLNVGDYVAIGATHGRIRAMIDDKGRRVKVATPSTPVEIQGLDEVPNAGEIMMAVADEKEARSIAEAFIAQSKEQLIAETKARLSLDGLFSQIQAGNVKELNLIIKADVMGSVEAVKQSLVKLSNEEVVVRVIHGGVGNINESDVSLASASNAIIIGFNVKPDNTAKDIADREGVEVKLYKVIYNAIDDIESAMKGMLKPVYEERVIAHAEVRMLFKASQVGIIAGSFVLDGKIERGCSARITRGGEQIYEGPLASLKRFKDDVKEVNAGYECGLVFEKFSDLAELDQIEFYKMVEVPRT